MSWTLASEVANGVGVGWLVPMWADGRDPKRVPGTVTKISKEVGALSGTELELEAGEAEGTSSSLWAKCLAGRLFDRR